MYIDEATPVASGTVCRRFRTGLSPATIRNIMVDLERRGFIFQPHTSAGRIPTELGYRHYVDAIMDPERLAPEEYELIEAQLVRRDHELGSLMETAAELLSSLTRLTSVVLFPRVVRETIRHIQLVPLSSTRVMLVWMLDSGLLRNAVVHIDETLDQMLVHKLTNFMNAELSGTTLDDVIDLLHRRTISEQGALFYIMQQAIDLLERGLPQVMTDRLTCGGTRWILSQPEFRDSARVSPLLHLLEDRGALLRLLYEVVDKPDDVRVIIGHENPLQELQYCSLVTSSYAVGGKPVGAIGVLGPTRMPYAKAVGAVKTVAGALTRVLTDAAAVQ